MYKNKMTDDAHVNKLLVMALITDAANDKKILDVKQAKVAVSGSRGEWVPSGSTSRIDPIVREEPVSEVLVKGYSRRKLLSAIDYTQRECARRSNLGMDSLEIIFYGQENQVVARIILD